MQAENKTENSQRIAVTGATGRVGSHLVEVLTRRGHDVVPIARSKGVDVVSGEGLDAALSGAETIIDTATGPSPDQEEATAFFTASARNLQRAGLAAGAKRIVVVSIIGIDKFQGGYNAAKLVQEGEDHRGRRPAGGAPRRGGSIEIRETSQSALVPGPDDPDAAAYAEGAALPNPGAKLAGPSFKEWLAAA